MFDPKDLPLLAVFAAVARHGSFTAAGRDLKLGKSVVSHHVQRLEERCGVRLLERTTRRLRLTQIGEQVLAASKPILEAVRDVELILDSHRAAPSGTIRVTAPHVLGDTLVTPTIARLLLLHPQLRADVVLDDSPRDIVGEQFDLGIRLGPFPPSTLVVRRLGADPEVIVGSPTASAPYLTAATPAELEGASWVGHAVLDASSRKTFKSETGRVEQVVFVPRVSVTRADAMRMLAIAGVGLAILPLHMVRSAIASGQLVRLCPAWCRRKIALQLVTPTRHVPARVAAFLTLARSVAQELGFANATGT
jgi:DNA-binding transcriptional LysR family regulator